MTDSSKPRSLAREELLSLLSLSGTLAGLCITIVAFMNTINRAHSEITIVDDLLAACAATFLLCIYLIFWALRASGSGISAMLVRIVDAFFLSALTCMTLSAFFMIYTIF